MSRVLILRLSALIIIGLWYNYFMFSLIPFILVMRVLIVSGTDLTLPKVKGVTVVEATTTTVTVRWQERASATKYKVRVLKDDDKVVAVTSTKKTRLTMLGLQPETAYQAQVRMIKNKRSGPWSKKVNFTTKAEEQENDDTSLYDKYKLVAGDYTGQWQNLTFGSNGDTSVTMTVEPDGAASFTIDLGGMVFGLLDPDSKTYSGTYNETGAVFSAVDDDLFGDLTITVVANDNDTANIILAGVDIPVTDIDGISATGTLYTDSLDLEYIVTFEDQSTADGVMNLTKTE